MRVLRLLGWVVAMASPFAHAAEFEDYDFSLFFRKSPNATGWPPTVETRAMWHLR